MSTPTWGWIDGKWVNPPASSVRHTVVTSNAADVLAAIIDEPSKPSEQFAQQLQLCAVCKNENDPMPQVFGEERNAWKRRHYIHLYGTPTARLIEDLSK